MYAAAHGIVAAIAVLMQVGKGHHFWLYAWAIPLAHVFIAGFEATMAGSVVGLMSVYNQLVLNASNLFQLVLKLIQTNIP